MKAGGRAGRVPRARRQSGSSSQDHQQMRPAVGSGRALVPSAGGLVHKQQTTQNHKKKEKKAEPSLFSVLNASSDAPSTPPPPPGGRGRRMSSVRRPAGERGSPYHPKSWRARVFVGRSDSPLLRLRAALFLRRAGLRSAAAGFLDGDQRRRSARLVERSQSAGRIEAITLCV